MLLAFAFAYVCGLLTWNLFDEKTGYLANLFTALATQAGFFATMCLLGNQPEIPLIVVVVFHLLTALIFATTLWLAEKSADVVIAKIRKRRQKRSMK